MPDEPKRIIDLPAKATLPEDQAERSRIRIGVDEVDANGNPVASYQVPLDLFDESPADESTPITVTAHGLTSPLSAPAVVMRVLLDDSLIMPPTDALNTTIYQVNWIAEDVVDSDTLKAYHVSELDSLGFREFGFASFPPDSYAWLQNDGTVSYNVASSTRLWYTHPTDNRKVSYFYSLFVDGGGGGSGTDTRNESRYSEFQSSVLVPSDTAINMNAATSGFTTIVDSQFNYDGHDSRTAATFNEFYPRYLEAHVGGVAISQNKIYRNDADPPGWVRFGEDIIAGTRILFRSSLEVVV